MHDLQSTPVPMEAEDLDSPPIVYSPPSYEPNFEEREQATKDYIRLLQIIEALKFLQFYHNHGGAQDLARRALYVLPLFINHYREIVCFWYPERHDNPEVFEISDYGDPIDHLFAREAWEKFRKTWMEGMTVQDSVHKLWLVFMDYLRANEDFTIKYNLQGVDKNWDTYNSKQKAKFFKKYLSVGADFFTKLVTGPKLYTWYVQDTFARLHSAEYATEYGKWLEAFAGSETRLGSSIYFYEFGHLGNELRHFYNSIQEYRELCASYMDTEFQNQWPVGKWVRTTPYRVEIPTKDELNSCTYHACSICYCDFENPSFPSEDIEPLPEEADTGQEDGEVPPVKLPCGHIFCEICLGRFLKGCYALEPQYWPECPYCRACFENNHTSDHSRLQWYRLVKSKPHAKNMYGQHPRAIALEAVQGLNKYLRMMPEHIAEPSKAPNYDQIASVWRTHDSLQELGNEVFGPNPEGILHTKWKENDLLTQQLAVLGIISLGRRLAAYLEGDNGMYQIEVVRNLKIQARFTERIFYWRVIETRMHYLCPDGAYESD